MKSKIVISILTVIFITNFHVNFPGYLMGHIVSKANVFVTVTYLLSWMLVIVWTLKEKDCLLAKVGLGYWCGSLITGLATCYVYFSHCDGMFLLVFLTAFATPLYGFIGMIEPYTPNSILALVTISISFVGVYAYVLMKIKRK